MWSVLELLTDTNRKNLNYSTTIKRLCFLFERDQHHKQILMHLKDRRNEFVHASSGSEFNEIILHQIRRYVEALYYYHLFDIMKFTDFEESCEFLDSSRDVEYLKKQLHRIKKALKYRTSPR